MLSVETAGYRDRVVPVAGTRVLGIRELGDPAGYPVLYFHGVPGLRQATVGRASDYTAAGVRLFTFDRPGYGRASPARDATVADWAEDVAAAVAELALPRFAVIGESGGGPYALACGLKPPPGLDAVVVSSGLAPVDEPGSLEGMKVINQLALRAFHHPDLAAPVLAGLAAAFGHWPDFVLDHVLCHDSPAGDRAFLRKPRIRKDAKAMLAATATEGLEGLVDDINRLAAPWGFTARDVVLPVRFWHGDEDNTAPLRHILRVAAAIPGSTVVVCPGEGHMVLERHLAEVLDFLVARHGSTLARS